MGHLARRQSARWKLHTHTHKHTHTLTHTHIHTYTHTHTHTCSPRHMKHHAMQRVPHARQHMRYSAPYLAIRSEIRNASVDAECEGATLGRRPCEVTLHPNLRVAIHYLPICIRCICQQQWHTLRIVYAAYGSELVHLHMSMTLYTLHTAMTYVNDMHMSMTHVHMAMTYVIDICSVNKDIGHCCCHQCGVTWQV